MFINFQPRKPYTIYITRSLLLLIHLRKNNFPYSTFAASAHVSNINYILINLNIKKKKYTRTRIIAPNLKA